ncbi:DNA-binding transcriptional regulator, FrmR family [[Clostridium] fimetarium]|uniref:DNA-binding transcriptional regulator, FrmR family n=1 Tax=[Clostridium] fimetarium TaxID=99656 RepID=A0A1I0R704_9FIRM|nr:metal-sensing transcriptional repressor [[Clostridium] fimetarium]SEW36386.1 DNA-binding transcriptional regulator, FrmR family [[Clostridium] fimetarium]
MDISKKQKEKTIDINQSINYADATKKDFIGPNIQSQEHCHDQSQELGRDQSQEHCNDKSQEHCHDQSQEHCHDHLQEEHNHQHTHQNTKAVINRLARAIGHLESVKKMVEDGRDCSDVLIQLAAVKSAINNTGKVILKDHIQTCIVDAIEERDWEKIVKMNEAIDQFIK